MGFKAWLTLNENVEPEVMPVRTLRSMTFSGRDALTDMQGTRHDGVPDYSNEDEETFPAAARRPTRHRASASSPEPSGDRSTKKRQRQRRVSQKQKEASAAAEAAAALERDAVVSSSARKRKDAEHARVQEELVRIQQNLTESQHKERQSRIAASEAKKQQTATTRELKS